MTMTALKKKTPAPALKVVPQKPAPAKAAPAPSTATPAPRPSREFATKDVTCQDRRFTITTGNQDGRCRGNACDDGHGNAAAVDCNADNGRGACGDTSGAGNCTVAK